MTLKVEREIVEEIRAGDMRVRIECDGEGLPAQVLSCHYIDGDEWVNVFNGIVSVSYLERVVAIIDERRRSSPDQRGVYSKVCPEHGRYEAVTENGYECPGCMPKTVPKVELVSQEAS